MAQDGAIRDNESARMGRVEVGAADAAVMDLEDQLARPRLRRRHGLDGKRFTQFVEDGGFHDRLLRFRGWGRAGREDLCSGIAAGSVALRLLSRGRFNQTRRTPDCKAIAGQFINYYSITT